MLMDKSEAILGPLPSQYCSASLLVPVSVVVVLTLFASASLSVRLEL